MRKGTSSWDDEQMKNTMGTVLRVGVLSAAFVVVLGGFLFFIQHPGEIIDYTTFKGEPARLRQVHVIIREALIFKSRAVIQLGLLLLIATPIARVFFSLIGFLIEKDWIYVIITFIVLSILFCSLLSNYYTF
jgi:uncharacterized membrane protein